jgi:uncharacterized protein (DUF302 family)
MTADDESSVPDPRQSHQTALERFGVAAAPEIVVEAVRNSLRSHGITEYAVVDHGADMTAAGAPGHVAWTLIFGNPAAGAKLLDRDPETAVDIPLRLAILGARHGETTIVLRDMRTLLPADLTDLADAFTQTLRALAADARERATTS